MTAKVGIDALYVYIPELYVDNEELAIARNEDPKHFIDGVGIKAFAVPSPNEDQATMAATAAYRLMETYNVSPEEIFRIDTPTESGLDASRAIVSDVVGMLEQVYGKGRYSHIMGYEQKFACVSGIERLLDTSAWFAADWNLKKYALILVTDIAKYELNSDAEPTQGAAATAILVGKNPRLLEIVPGALGSALRNEKTDFKKPGGRTIALVDTGGKGRSYASYLSEMKQAWLNFSLAVRTIEFIKPNKGDCVIDYVNKAAYHNPHKKMVINAYASLLMHEWRDLPRWETIREQIGEEPTRAEMNDLEYYLSSNYNEYRRKFTKLPEFLEDLNKKIGSSMVAPDFVGNSYSASVFVGLNSIFENDKEDISDRNLVLCGYGSGSHALIQANKIPSEYKSILKSFDLMQRLAGRRKLSIEEYEELHKGNIQIENWPIATHRRFILEKIGKPGTVDEGDRDYTFVS
jgi:hydroxymethylglutaryl-CoA synthase